MAKFFKRSADRREDLEKKAEKAGRDIVTKVIEAHRKSKAEWAAQPKDVRDTYFWAKILTFTELIPTMLLTIVSWKAALVTSVVVAVPPALCLHKRNFKLSLVSALCCVFGLLFGFAAKAALYFMVIRNIHS